MAIRPGTLRERVQLRTPGATSDGAGGVEGGTPTTVATVWAAVVPRSGRQEFLAGQRQSFVTHEVKIRYRADVRPSWHLVWRGRTLRVLSVVADAHRTELNLLCEEQRARV